MRSALISIPGQPAATLAGKTLARRQLDFALAAGCESVIALGDGGSAEAIGLRHAAEAAGARFQAIRDCHGLLGAVRAEDELLALAPGLLPEAPEVLELLGKGKVVLVLPAGTGVAAGFERIDLERAWAGALVVGGAHVERLSDLPADIEPASALVRIALQGHVKERRLPDDLIAEGSWRVLREGAVTPAIEEGWLKRHFAAAKPWMPTRWLAGEALRPVAARLLAARRSVEALAAGAAVVLGVAILASWFGLAALGFVLVPLGGVLAQAAVTLAGLRHAPFGRRTHKDFTAFLPWLVDAGLFACAVLAIEGSWLHRLFPPLVMLAALRGLRQAEPTGWLGLSGDRSVLAVLLAVAAALGLAEPAIMVAALALIAINLR